MDNKFNHIQLLLKREPRTWLITGVAGFIGSHLLELLLRLNQRVIGLDNFSTGYYHNLYEVESLVSPDQWGRFRLIEGDIQNPNDCQRALDGVDHVLHQAALGSVPRSIVDPLATHAVNATGFLNMLIAAKNQNVRSFVYASSSSVYGDHPALPKEELTTGKPLSPYAVTKYINELYADVFHIAYKFQAIGLRYFNVFGPRQDPNGPYAAVIPKWINAMSKNETVFINGDGTTSRDFCYVANAVQANILASLAEERAQGKIYNVALNDRTSLTQIAAFLIQQLMKLGIHYTLDPVYQDFRAGDILHSQADITRSKAFLGYNPLFSVESGLQETLRWYIKNVERNSK